MPSYSPVYSAQFIIYTPSTPNTTFDVPEGYTAVIRQVTVVQDIGAYALYVYIQNSPEAPGLQVVSIAGADAYTNYSEETRIVVPGGGTISVDLVDAGTSFNVYVGGYLLQNTLS